MNETTSKNARLSIFDTFKTRTGLTGEAKRQRSIISILADNGNPTEKTRTGISRQIAKDHGVSWKNIYSGVFRDLDEILIPMEIVKEHGRLPLRRGPRVLQESGIPYYHLTKRGLLVALSIGKMENQRRLLLQFLAESDIKEKEFEKTILMMQESSPHFTYSLFQKYVKTFCNGEFEDLLPFDLAKLGKTLDRSLIIQKEILESFMGMPKRNMQETVRFLNKITASSDDN